MVGLNPAKFYGRLLPRPRIYCDVKFSDARVDPPESVNAALLEWASDASWKMGGTSSKRKRMSGKIEGRMSKLRAMEESDEEPSPPKQPAKKKQLLSLGKSEAVEVACSPAKSMTPIEKMLATPSPKREKASPRRRISGEFNVERTRGKQRGEEKTKRRRRRTEPAIGDSEDDSDDGLEGFMQDLKASTVNPPKRTRSSARLQESPETPRTPISKKSPMKGSAPRSSLRLTPGSFRSPVSRKRRDESDSESDSRSDSEIQQSQSVIM